MRSSFIGLTIMTKGQRIAHGIGASFRSMSARPKFWLAAATVTASLIAPGIASAAPFGFAPAKYVDDTGRLAGGEPVLTTDPIHHTIVYSSHEGTTHIYKNGLPSETTFLFLSGYRNQVNNWTSSDGGKTWKFAEFLGTGFTQPPVQNTGFSDPDLTQDAGGRIYNTGIDLVNDALFSSADGGKTWDRGTPECHDGDRPWLAGGKKDEVFMATNTGGGQLAHQIFQSTDGGQTCSTSGITGEGDLPDGRSFVGNGKLYYVRSVDRLVEPINTSGSPPGVGISTWKRGDATTTPHEAVRVPGGVYAHWPAITIDDAGGVYLVFDEDPRQPGTSGGCGGDPTPAPSRIRLVYSPDLGAHWNAPITVAAPAGQRTLWPWVAAGDPGKVNVVWYQTNNLADLACQNADLRAMSATILGADTNSPQIFTADAAGRPISKNGNICQSGTTCVATGEDRRLGDFFTNAVDERGCAIIGSGDTTSLDPVSGGPRNIALPLFMHQNSGPALRGGGDCSGEQASLGLPNSSAGTAPGAGGGAEPNNASNTRRNCVSRRKFRIRLRAPQGERLSRATIFVAGRQVTVTSHGKRYRTLRGKLLRAPVNLSGLPEGTFTVRVQAVAHSGNRFIDLRTYRTCAEKKKPKPKRHPLKPKKKKSRG
jgi:hypothetical protein